MMTMQDQNSVLEHVRNYFTIMRDQLGPEALTDEWVRGFVSGFFFYDSLSNPVMSVVARLMPQAALGMLNGFYDDCLGVRDALLADRREG